jgi:hypothetical protein
MTTTKEIVDWLIIIAKKNNFAYIILVCDTFSYNEYPIFVHHTDNLEVQKKKFDNVNGQRINEVIDLSKYNKKGELIK